MESPTPTAWPVPSLANQTESLEVWWPQVRAAVLMKRKFVRMMLEVATASLDDGTLHLTFHRPGAADHFIRPESGCMIVLETALAEHGVDVAVDVHQG